MLFFHLFLLSLLLAFSAPATPEPYFKVIFSNGEVLAELVNIPSIQLNRPPTGGVWSIQILPPVMGWQYLTIWKDENKQWSDYSFVIERKPGHDCNTDKIPGTYQKLTCRAEFEIRELNAEEKAKAAKIKPGEY